MEIYRTDEEQAEALKQWWQNYGKSVLFVMLVCLSLALGWKAWDSHQKNTSAAASAVYESLVNASQAAEKPGATEVAKSTAVTLGQQVIKDYPKTIYAQMAAFYLAKFAVQKGDLAQAGQHLEWVIKNNSDKGISLTAHYRLAKVRLAQGQHTEAQALVKDIQAPAYLSAVEELLGDIAVAKGDIETARKHYKRSSEAAQNKRPFVDLKWDDIKS